MIANFPPLGDGGENGGARVIKLPGIKPCNKLKELIILNY